MISVIYVVITCAHSVSANIFIAGLNERLDAFEDCNIRIQNLDNAVWEPLTIATERCGHICQENAIRHDSKWYNSSLIRATRGCNFKFRKICQLDLIVHLSNASFSKTDYPLAWQAHIEDGFVVILQKYTHFLVEQGHGSTYTLLRNHKFDVYPSFYKTLLIYVWTLTLDETLNSSIAHFSDIFFMIPSIEVQWDEHSFTPYILNPQSHSLNTFELIWSTLERQFEK